MIACNCVLTIGKFEGIHLGHQTLLMEVKRQAKSHRLSSAVMIFDPHPYIYLNNTQYKPLFTKEERSHILQNIGPPDYLFYYPFDKTFAALSPQDFCKILFEKYSAKLVIVGENYRFGKNRVGDIVFLQKCAATYNAKVQVVPPCKSSLVPSENTTQSVISTSNIRKHLAELNLLEANCQLGFPFFIMGTVTKGKQLGRTIGFPTLNVYPPDEKFLPSDGVYATQTTINGVKYYSVTNIGLRTTVESDCKIRTTETHLLNYTGSDLYGEHIKVELLEFIRHEYHFNSLDELKTQIAKDILNCKPHRVLSGMII